MLIKTGRFAGFFVRNFNPYSQKLVHTIQQTIYTTFVISLSKFLVFHSNNSKLSIFKIDPNISKVTL